MTKYGDLSGKISTIFGEIFTPKLLSLLRYTSRLETEEDGGEAATDLAAEIADLVDGHKASTILAALAMVLHENVMPLHGDPLDEIHHLMDESDDLDEMLRDVKEQVSKVKPKFSSGPITCTDAAMEVIVKNRQKVTDLVIRHVQGDWGHADRNDRRMNEQTLQARDGRLMSVYYMPDGNRVWVITELAGASEGSTTILLPSDY